MGTETNLAKRTLKIVSSSTDELWAANFDNRYFSNEKVLSMLPEKFM
jgi:hypothetical protein